MSITYSAIVESSSISGSTNAPNATITVASSQIDGFLFVAWNNGGGSIGNPTVTDSKSQTWTLQGSTITSGSGVTGAIYHCANPAAGSTTVTATLSATAGIYAFELFTTGGSNGADVTSTSADSNFQGTGSNAVKGASITPTSAGDDIISFMVTVSGGGSLSAGTSPNAFTTNATGYATILVQHFSQTTAAAIQPTATASANSDVLTLSYALKAASGGGTAYNLNVSGGAFNLAGVNAYAGFELDGAPGAFAFAGGPVTFTSGSYSISASPGQYFLTGQNISLAVAGNTVQSTVSGYPQLLTTGTFNSILIDNRTFIDRAYGALKLRPQQITGEMVQIALDIMNLVQLDMLNDAAPLWTKKKHVVPLVQGQMQYNMPPATNDIDSAFYRTMTNLTSGTTITQNASAYQWTFPQPTQVNTVCITWPSGVSSIPVTFQSSPDGVNWTTVSKNGFPDWNQSGPISIANDLDNAGTYQYWQVIPTIATQSLPLTISGQVYNNPQDVLMARMNKDDYWNLTQKTFPGRPLQYWVDRQIVPRMNLWPVPDSGSAQNFMAVWRQRMLCDVGSLTNTIEVAPRWYMAFFYRVASELAFCTPEVDPEITAQIGPKADAMWRKAWNEERDKSPVRFQTNLSPYTR